MSQIFMCNNRRHRLYRLLYLLFAITVTFTSFSVQAQEVQTNPPGTVTQAQSTQTTQAPLPEIAHRLCRLNRLKIFAKSNKISPSGDISYPTLSSIMHRESYIPYRASCIRPFSENASFAVNYYQ